MKFTKTEWEIIKDRLEVSDCIVEVFFDTDECPVTETEDQIYKRCDELYALTPNDEVDMNDNLTAQIIYDCCDGSTFLCGMPWDLDRLVKARYFKAAYSLEKKLNVSIPTD